MKWISVKDKSPPQDELVLCWNPRTEWEKVGALTLASTSLGISIGYGWRRNITHWMPLPNPPKEKLEIEEEDKIQRSEENIHTMKVEGSNTGAYWSRCETSDGNWISIKKEKEERYSSSQSHRREEKLPDTPAFAMPLPNATEDA